jgi:hypothetical protein
LVLEALEQPVAPADLVVLLLFLGPYLRLVAGKAEITIQIKQTGGLAAVLEKVRQLLRVLQGKVLLGGLPMTEQGHLEAAAAQALRGVMEADLVVLEVTAHLVQ